MSRFYNPYQFIPFNRDSEQERSRESPKQYEVIEKGEEPHIRHDRWDENGCSGRILCRLEVISPLVIGAHQEQPDENEPATVIPYAEGQRLPANSLRGMIASVAESISNSAMRVLNKREAHEYSVRMRPNSAFRKIGLLLQVDGQYRLYPLPKFESVPRSQLRQMRSYQHQDNNGLEQWHGKTGIFYLRGYPPDMPNKKKEYFIPWDGNLDSLAKPLAVGNDIVSALNRELAKAIERKPEFPYLPVGYQRPERNAKKGIVRSGDLVFFHAKNSTVTAISYSAIWRCQAGNLYEYLENINKDLLPWNKDRKALTPAEALFGVIEKAADGGVMDNAARNLASRLRFHDAQAEHEVELLGGRQGQLLKILASPKPPSPSMYFHDPQGGYIDKQELNLRQALPNGRKRYLSHPDWETTINNKNKWETAYPDDKKTRKQKLYCHPIPSKSKYWFHIDFENLSENELDLLRRAITPAADREYRHQLGLGKPLGLGQVKVEEIGLFLIDRKSRYGLEGVFSARYHKAHIQPDENLPDRYREQIDIRSETKKPLKEPEHNPLLDTTALQAMQKIGCPEYMEENLSVCYPYDASQGQKPYAEKQGFKWFMNNEEIGKQCLASPLAQGNLQPLETFEKVELRISIRGRKRKIPIGQIRKKLHDKLTIAHKIGYINLNRNTIEIIVPHSKKAALLRFIDSPLSFKIGQVWIEIRS